MRNASCYELRGGEERAMSNVVDGKDGRWPSSEAKPAIYEVFPGFVIGCPWICAGRAVNIGEHAGGFEG